MGKAIALCFHSGNAGDYRALPEVLELMHRCAIPFLPLLTVAEHLVARRMHELPEVSCCLTFDDGMDMDFFDLPHPVHGDQPSFETILRNHDEAHGGATGVHGTSFVIASPLARAVIQERDLMGLPWMSDRWWNPAVATGRFHIANHSWDHLSASLDEVKQREQKKGDFSVIDNHEDAEWQVRKAREMIHRICPNPGTSLFAYPYGHRSRYLIDEYFPNAESGHGTTAAVTGDPLPITEATSRWELPRYVYGEHWKDIGELQRIVRS